MIECMIVCPGEHARDAIGVGDLDGTRKGDLRHGERGRIDDVGIVFLRERHRLLNGGREMRRVGREDAHGRRGSIPHGILVRDAQRVDKVAEGHRDPCGQISWYPEVAREVLPIGERHREIRDAAGAEFRQRCGSALSSGGSPRTGRATRTAAERRETDECKHQSQTIPTNTARHTALPPLPSCDAAPSHTTFRSRGGGATCEAKMPGSIGADPVCWPRCTVSRSRCHVAPAIEGRRPSGEPQGYQCGGKKNVTHAKNPRVKCDCVDQSKCRTIEG